MGNNLESIEGLKDRLVNLLDFITEMEKDLFNYEKQKVRSDDIKAEYYKLAKSSFINDLKSWKELKEVKMDPQIEMINMLLNSLTKEEKTELLDFVIKMARRKNIVSEV